jgi:hypothetical protein
VANVRLKSYFINIFRAAFIAARAAAASWSRAKRGASDGTLGLSPLGGNFFCGMSPGETLWVLEVVLWQNHARKAGHNSAAIPDIA